MLSWGLPQRQLFCGLRKRTTKMRKEVALRASLALTLALKLSRHELCGIGGIWECAHVTKATFVHSVGQGKGDEEGRSPEAEASPDSCPNFIVAV